MYLRNKGMLNQALYLALAFFYFYGWTAQASEAVPLPEPEVKAIDAPKHVLFVGNSFSYFNDGLHNHVSNLLRASGDWRGGDYRLRLLTLSGSKLLEHTHNLSYMLESRPGWDAVVFHEHSKGPIADGKREDFKAGAEEFNRQLRKASVQPVLLMTWAYADEPAMAISLARAYTNMANDLNAFVVPAGLAFDGIRRSHPEINLYTPDVSGFDKEGRTRYKKDVKHPSLAGTYLTACVVYASLWQQSPVALPYNPGLDKEVLAILQKQAWRTVQTFYQNTSEVDG